MESIESDDLQGANKKALHALENGASGLKFSPLQNFISSKKDLELLLKDIQVELISLQFGSALSTKKTIEWFKQVCNDRDLDTDTLDVAFAIDPFAHAAALGKLPEINALRDLSKNIDRDFKIFTVDASLYANSGASIIQLLAFALAAGNDFLGLSP
jgi:methylmalonyl-CoA mutase